MSPLRSQPTRWSPWLSRLFVVAMVTLLVTIAESKNFEYESGDDKSEKKSAKHGGIKMGVSNDECDDAETGIEVDWDGKDPTPYECTNGESVKTGEMPPYKIHEKKTKEPIHVCLFDPLTKEPYPITYDSLPLSGKHRPLWPVFGEYVYVPPQRWVHSLEHAAIVFLYHPCAPDEVVDEFRKVVSGCIRKHIITPSKMLSTDRPYALISWGHGIFMDHFSEPTVRRWIKAHGMKDGPEAEVHREGQYKIGLKQQAKFVDDEKEDSDVCGAYERRLKLTQDT